MGVPDKQTIGMVARLLAGALYFDNSVLTARNDQAIGVLDCGGAKGNSVDVF